MRISKQLAAYGFAATVSFAWGATTSAPKPTFHRDVQPILQNRCQTCHRPGEIGRVPFLTYKETRPWAKAIKEAVVSRKMPPWFADPHYGKFSNDRSLSAEEIETITAWVNTGAPEGDPKDAPAARKWTEGWGIDKPDAVIQIPSAFKIPAAGTVEYQYIVVPTGFTEDKWVQAVEARPTARAVVHHVVVYVREPGEKWLRGEAQPGVPFVPPKKNEEGKPRGDISGAGNEVLTIYTPGNSPDVFPLGRAKKIKAGSDLVFQMHYTASGKAAEDQTRVGMIFAKEPPKERVMTLFMGGTDFVIPPGDPNYMYSDETELPSDSILLSFFPHMHVRGKAFEYRLTLPGKPEQTVLRVPNYNFNWQLTYRLEQPMFMPAGSKFNLRAWWDNSPNNPYNPDPKSEVRFGEQSWEEMMVGFVDVAVGADMDRRKFWKPDQAAKPKGD